MKRIYLLLALIIGMVSSAYAESTSIDYPVNFYVVADQMMADVCVVTDNDSNEYNLTTGSNSFIGTYRETTEVNSSGTYVYGYFVTQFNLTVKNDASSTYAISKCTVINNGNSSDVGYSSSYPTSSLTLTSNLTWNKSEPNYTFNPTLTTLASLRTASATVTINDASKVRITCGSYEPSLSNGTQTISFNPSSEYSWVIGPKESGQYLDSVTKNGSSQSPSGNNYYMGGSII